jgi:tetratricopeptide (TPR) repeat protein
VHRLVLQLARDGRLPEALNAVNVAVGIAPQSPVLRRIQIVLSAKRETIEAAREVCPWDPEVWLAWFVARFREEGAGEWIPAVVRQAVAARVPASTLVRAGDFLLRNKASKEATLVAREAIARADGLLAAYVLGLNCALVLRDPQWALDCALQGVDRAADPIPFYKVIVMLKASKSATDADMVRALEFLRSRFPAEIRWAEGLGVVSFERGDTRRAFRVLGEIVDDHMKQMRVRSLLLAAESARVEGDLGRAIGILEAAYGLYPTEVSVLNNLIYTLTANETGRERASELISRLLERGKERYEVHDTAAVVYLRLGRIEDARREVEEALRRCDEKSYGAGEVHLNAAEIYLQLGQVEQARQQVEIVLKRTDRSVFLDRRAGDLMRRIREAGKRQGSNP